MTRLLTSPIVGIFAVLAGCGGTIRDGSYFHAPPLTSNQTREAAAIVDIAHVRHEWIVPVGVRTYEDQHIVIDLLVVMDPFAIGPATPEEYAQFATNAVQMPPVEWGEPRSTKIKIRLADGTEVRTTRTFRKTGSTATEDSRYGLVPARDANPAISIVQGEADKLASVVPVFLETDRTIMAGDVVTVQLIAGEIQGGVVDTGQQAFTASHIKVP